MALRAWKIQLLTFRLTWTNSKYYLKIIIKLSGLISSDDPASLLSMYYLLLINREAIWKTNLNLILYLHHCHYVDVSLSQTASTYLLNYPFLTRIITISAIGTTYI